MRPLILLLCTLWPLAACQTIDNEWMPVYSTRIVLGAEQFRDETPEIKRKETFCGSAEKAVWTTSANVAVVQISSANLGCVVLEANPSIKDLVKQWKWLEKADTRQDGESILTYSLGSPVWIHFLRRKDQPCIIFRYGIGDSGSSINEYPELIRGFFCKKWSSTITPNEATAFVKGIRIGRKQGS